MKRPVLGIVSVGIGALPVLQQLLLAAPFARYPLIVDYDLLTLIEHGDGRAQQRLCIHRSLLEADYEADVACFPELAGVPADTMSARVRSAQANAALELSRTGRVAVLGQSGQPNHASALVDEINARGGMGCACLTSTLEAVVSRGIERDDITVGVVREVAAKLRDTDADVVIFAIPGAHLVEDLFRRSLGAGIAIVDSSTLWASQLAAVLETSSTLDREPEVDLLVAGGDAKYTESLVTEYLQLRPRSVRGLDELAARAVLSPRDEVLLAYDSLTHGDRESTVALLHAGAVVRSASVPDRHATDLVDECLRRGVRLQVDELMSTDETVGVVGRALVRDRKQGAAATYAFSHLVRFEAGRITVIEIVECQRTPPRVQPLDPTG